MGQGMVERAVDRVEDAGEDILGEGARSTLMDAWLSLHSWFTTYITLPRGPILSSQRRLNAQTESAKNAEKVDNQATILARARREPHTPTDLYRDAISEQTPTDVR